MRAKPIGLIRNKNKKEPQFITYLFVIWAVLMIVSVVITLSTPTKIKNRYYDEQIEAANLAKNAMAEIKNRKIELGIPLSEKDIYNSGMIGEWFTDITTTSGMIEAKRTAINPDFAAVYIDMFKEAGLKKGDEVALVMSGSFPTLNISAMAAVQVYGLKPCIMASVGASTYGATSVNFTFFDMAEHLYNKGILTNRIDYISFGGANDDGYEFPDEVRESILKRFNDSKIEFLCESDFHKNVKERTKKIFEKCPNVKLLVSVGGTLVAMGEGDTGSSLYRGLVKPNYLNSNKDIENGKLGLMDTFLNRGIPIVQMLNIKGIALDYGIEYDPVVMPEIGESDTYYEISYNLLTPIIAVITTIGILVFYYIWKKKRI